MKRYWTRLLCYMLLVMLVLSIGCSPGAGNKTVENETKAPDRTEQTLETTDLESASALGRPEPIKAGDEPDTETAYVCTLSVRCSVLLENSDALNKNKRDLVPEDGILFEGAVVFYDGESVFHVLQREMKQNKIHMEFKNTPGYQSAYIMGIGNLYEFDAGDLSGWVYKVNDWFPNYGCSGYRVKDGDVIEWLYTTDLGRDVGGRMNDGEA